MWVHPVFVKRRCMGQKNLDEAVASLGRGSGMQCKVHSVLFIAHQRRPPVGASACLGSFAAAVISRLAHRPVEPDANGRFSVFYRFLIPLLASVATPIFLQGLRGVRCSAGPTWDM